MRRPLNPPIVITQPFAATDVDYSQFGLLGHHGQDAQANIGTPVYAPENSVVTTSSNGTTDQYTGRVAAGEVIVLKGTYEHWLMHLSQRLVSVGQSVAEGQLIGYTGNTGFTTGPHLHWGTRPLNPNINNGYRGFIDPANVLTNQGATMSTLDLGLARVLAHGVLGRNGLAGRQNALSGECDADLNKNHVGKESNGKIWEMYNSAEGVAYRTETAQTYAEKAGLKQALANMTADRDQLIKKLDVANSDKNKQAQTISELQAQVDTLTAQNATLQAENDELNKKLATAGDIVTNLSGWEYIRIGINKLLKWDK